MSALHCSQGDVESIASRTPAELTKLFENISDSDELIAEYDDLKRAKTQAEEELKFAPQKKKGFTAEKRQYKEQVEEASVRACVDRPDRSPGWWPAASGQEPWRLKSDFG